MNVVELNAAKLFSDEITQVVNRQQQQTIQIKQQKWKILEEGNR